MIKRTENCIAMRKLIASVLLTLPLFVNAQIIEQSDNSLRVEGKFITKEKPELLNLFIEITMKNKDYRVCSDSLFLIMQESKNVFIANGIDKNTIKTIEMGINEDEQYHDGERIKVGYVGNIRLEIEDKFDQSFSEKLLISIRSLTNKVSYGIKFKLSESQKETLRKTSIEKAIQDAKQKAELIAKNSNVTLLRINKISYDSQNGQISRFNFESEIVEEMRLPQVLNMESLDNVGSFDMNPKEISIYQAVVVEWKIK